MTFLFDYIELLQAHFILKNDIDKGGSDTVLVGKRLWQKLLSHSSGFTNARLCVSLGSPKNSQFQQTQLPTSQILGWALLDEEVEPTSIGIPPPWLDSYSHIFPRNSLHSSSCQSSIINLTVIHPIVLTEVILITGSPAAFAIACECAISFDSWLVESRILRHGDVHSLRSQKRLVNGHHYDDAEFRYRVGMLEPLPQGYVQKDVTRFVVTLIEDDGMPTSETTSSDDWGSIEIDERFLASTALSTPFHDSFGISTRHGDEHSSCITTPKRVFTCVPLASPISLVDDHCTLYLKTSDLVNLGILSSDWAVAVFPGSLRLVRVIANDRLVAPSGQLRLAPTLLFNILSRSPLFSTHEPPIISLLPSPFGSHSPSIPTARIVTLARVASTISTNRQYQHAFLGALKIHFDVTKRLVKNGDLIAVSIDTDCCRWAHESSGSEISDPIHLSNLNRTNEIVFFMVTNIEYDVPNTRDSGSIVQDMYLGSRMGEFGCWVDTSVTRVVQAGIEHSRIPDIGTYFDLDREGLDDIKFDVTNGHVPPSSSGSTPFQKLFSLASATLAKSAIDYELDLTFLLNGNRGVGKFTVASWVAQKLGIHLLEISCYDLLGENNSQTEGALRARFDQAINCSPCMLILRNLEALSQTTQNLEITKEPFSSNIFRECIEKLRQSWKLTGYPVLLVGTTHEPKQMQGSILSHFKREVMFEAPDEAERFEILERLLAFSPLSPDVCLSSLAMQTAALVPSDLVDLVARAKAHSLERLLKISPSEIGGVHIPQVGAVLTALDFDVALGKARDLYSESIGAPKIPAVSWDDVGGLAHVKTDILDTIQLPLEHPELFSDGLKKRSGILLYGPPGTGKTLVAKAVATSFSLNFFSVKGPELLNMYIGESEANVRRVFQKARDAKPCVIFFDELDSIAPKRGNQGDSGGVMDRIVSQLLAELDGMAGGQAGADVFVVGATNRPDLLDPALLRPGRFDRMLYLGVSETREAQLNIMEALTRKFRLDPTLDLSKVANKCSFNYTGADFYALCSDAMLNAMSRKATTLEACIAEFNKSPERHKHPYPVTAQYYLSEIAPSQEILVTVTLEDFDLALEHLVPSVSQAEMEHYALVQKLFSQD